jgi:hypothetical protein
VGALLAIFRCAHHGPADVRVRRTERNVNIERVWYEGSPYLYAATGIVAASHTQGSLLMSGSATLLVCASLTILAFRWMHRRDTAGAPTRLDEQKYIVAVTDDLFFTRDARSRMSRD